MKKKGRSDSTVIAYAKDIEQLLNYFSAKGIGALEKVTIKNLEAYRQNLLVIVFVLLALPLFLTAPSASYRFESAKQRRVVARLESHCC